jgi:isochorismate hydrolase
MSIPSIQAFTVPESNETPHDTNIKNFIPPKYASAITGLLYR